MPLGGGQQNCLFELALDQWEDQVFFNEKAYPAGYFATSVMNLDPMDIVKYLNMAELLVKAAGEFQKSDKDGRSEAGRKLKAKLYEMIDATWQIEPFSLLDKNQELQAIDKLLSEQTLDQLLAENSDEGKLIKLYVGSIVRVGQAITNFNMVARPFETLWLHFLKRRDETFYVHAVMYCIQDMEKVEAMKIGKSAPIENFSFTLRLHAATTLLRHPTKDLTMVFGTRFLFDKYIDFYTQDLLNGMHNGHAPFLCENCGRYYLATNGYITRYCDGVAPQDPKYTCRQFGALNQQKEKNADHPIHRLYKTRTNTIRKHQERKKITPELREAAIELAQTYRDMALFDNAYAAEGYERDMELENLYAEAKKKLP